MKTSYLVLKRELSTLFTHQYLLVANGESDTIQPMQSVIVSTLPMTIDCNKESNTPFSHQ